MARPQKTHGAPGAVALAVLLTLLMATTASAQQAGRARGAPKAAPLITWGALAGAVRTPARSVSTADVQEQEPNNDATTAGLVSIGDDAVGVIGVTDDIDFFAVDLAAGTTIDLEVRASRVGSALDPWLDFYGTDGTTLLTFNDDSEGLDSRIVFTVSDAGRYYFAISDFDFLGSPSHTYRILVRTVQPGPGDPTTLRAGVPSAWSAVAAPGVIYLLSGETISRYALTGGVTPFATGLLGPVDLALDGFGNLLVAGRTADGRGVITRVRPDGTRSEFAASTASASGVAVGPDGHVWVADHVDGRIHRYDSFGVSVSSVAVTGLTPLSEMAFSPAGVLHVSNYAQTVFRLQGGVLQPVITYSSVGGIAFDRDGYLYLSTFNRGILLFNPSYQLVHEPFAIQSMVQPGNIVFARDATGSVTSRLLVSNFGDGTLREVNPAAVRAPGFRVGVDLLIVTTQSLKAGVVGTAYADTVRIEEAVSPLTWSVASGQLPPGITLSAGTGVLSGVPEAHGSFTVSLRAEGGGRLGERAYTLSVTRPVVDAGAAANHLLGQEMLTPELRTFLDLQGNRNGRFDIGDLRAYLRSTGGGTQASDHRN